MYDCMSKPEFEIGERVQIYQSFYGHDSGKNIKHKGYGRVISYTHTDNLSYHGSADFEVIYTVIGENGKEYEGFKDRWEKAPMIEWAPITWFKKENE